MVFVNSMSDLFHEDVPDDYIAAVVRVMRLANWHTYQVLTKRSERLRDLLRTQLRDRRRRAAHLVGRQRREPHARPAADRPPAGGAGARCGSCRSSRCWRTSGEFDLDGHRTG